MVAPTRTLSREDAGMGDVRIVERLALGDHVCWVFEDQDECLAAMVRFVATGLAAREGVLYLTGSLSPASLVAGLEAHGVAAQRAIESGQLRVAPAADVYLSDGRFDPTAVLDACARYIDQAVEDGYAGLRVIGDMA